MSEYNLGDYYEPHLFEGLKEVMAIIVPFLLFYGFLLLLALTSYVIRAIAVQRMSKNRGIANGWLAWIPLAMQYQLGEVGGSIDAGKLKLKKPGIWLILIPIINSVICLTLYVVMILKFVFDIIKIGSRSYINESQAVLDFFGSVFGFAFAVAFVIMILSALYYAVRGLVLYKIYSYGNLPQKSVLFLLLSLFVPLCEPILLLMNSNKQSLTYAAQSEYTPTTEAPTEEPFVMADPLTSMQTEDANANSEEDSTTDSNNQ